MTRTAFNAAALLIGVLVVTAIAAIAWRAADEDEIGYDGKAILITVDYVTHCQTMTQECYAAADAALDRVAAKDCLDRKPGRRAMARGALIWLNAHVELHPLALDTGIARAVHAIWPRCATR